MKGFEMINAKTEFLEEIKDKSLLCALINREIDYRKYDTYVLPVDFTKEQLDNFLNAINFTYDDGYGSQELFGTIWYCDDTWSDREEYDGKEWWEHKEVPPIPEECLKPKASK